MLKRRHRTPLRYPGGKQRLAPFVEELLIANDALGCNYVEPYAGGAGVAMELLIAGRVAEVHLNDSSRPIYAFWHSVKHRADELCERIWTASLTIEEWQRQREIMRDSSRQNLLDLGFSTFFMNRCNRSGVLNAGIIGGKAQDGPWKMDARFQRTELVGRIEAIAQHSDRLHVYNLDAEKFLSVVNKLPSNTFVYLDPPYYERAERLYLNAYQPDDHARVAEMVQTRLRRKWIVSYDNHDEIARLYRSRRRFIYSIQYSAITPYSGSELFIFADDVTVPSRSALPYVDRAIPTLHRRVRRSQV